jgi:MoaA/NifB/PqqE/SkfB family radical SAM enzyme
MFNTLEETVNRMNAAGFEVHLCVHLTKPDFRRLAYDHDYAMRRSVKGLYCQLSFAPSLKTNGKRRPEEEELDHFIEEIAMMKSFSPDQMYFSPQCVRYGHHSPEHELDVDVDGLHHHDVAWHHWCLAGRTYAFIGTDGTVRACSGLEPPCGNLRTNGYNFKQIWESATVFTRLRGEFRSCSQTRKMINPSSAKSHNRNR